MRLAAEPPLQRIHAVKSFARDGGFVDRDAVGFLDADGELQGVDGIEPEAVGAEEERFGLDFAGRNPEHAVLDQKLSDIIEGDLGHKEG